MPSICWPEAKKDGEKACFRAEKRIFVEHMKNGLSILIPTYNDDCSALVAALSAQACQSGASYEIIVGDDGSTTTAVRERNAQACTAAHCRYFRREANGGRAAIRNQLARQAQYDWLLFIDCHVDVAHDFISNYASWQGHEAVVCGGVKAGGDAHAWNGNLRYRYEHAAETRHDVSARRSEPYQSFRTTNFMIRRETALAHPFDEHFRNYGYEDVLYGKQLEQQGIGIAHISNEVAINHYESNRRYIEKMEEALCTLHAFSSELRGYSRLLSLADRLKSWHLEPAIAWLFRHSKGLLRRNLCSRHPSLSLFTAYRLGYFLEIEG